MASGIDNNISSGLVTVIPCSQSNTLNNALNQTIKSGFDKNTIPDSAILDEDARTAPTPKGVMIFRIPLIPSDCMDSVWIPETARHFGVFGSDDESTLCHRFLGYFLRTLGRFLEEVETAKQQLIKRQLQENGKGVKRGRGDITQSCGELVEDGGRASKRPRPNVEEETDDDDDEVDDEPTDYMDLLLGHSQTSMSTDHSEVNAEITSLFDCVVHPGRVDMSAAVAPVATKSRVDLEIEESQNIPMQVYLEEVRSACDQTLEYRLHVYIFSTLVNFGSVMETLCNRMSDERKALAKVQNKLMKEFRADFSATDYLQVLYCVVLYSRITTGQFQGVVDHGMCSSVFSPRRGFTGQARVLNGGGRQPGQPFQHV